MVVASRGYNALTLEWTPERYAFVDWKLLPDGGTCYQCSKLVQEWFTRETDPQRKEALSVLWNLMLLEMAWEPLDGQALNPPHLLAKIPRDALVVLTEFLPQIRNPEVRARIADAAWGMSRACSASVAAAAARDYLETANSLYDPDEWSESFTRYQRALRLAATLGRKQATFTEAADTLLQKLRDVAVDEPLYFSLRMVELFLAQRIGDPAELATIVSNVAKAALAMGELDRARRYLECSAQCWKRANNPGRATAALRSVVDLLLQEVNAAGTTEEETIHAAILTDEAIKLLRTMGGAGEEIAHLKVSLQRLRAAAVANFKSIEVGGLDLSAHIASARDAVRGKSAWEALVQLVRLWHPDTKDELRRRAIDVLRDAPFYAMVAKQRLDDSGRLIHRRSGALDGDGEDAIVGQMHEDVTTCHQVFASGGILPALRQLQSEHGLRLDDMKSIAARSSFVPPGRESLFARGLAAGLNEDFIVSAHLLFPQFEHAVRWHLNEAGVSTLTLPASGIQNELDLGALLDRPETAQMFGDPLLFDLKSLLVEKAGANLRNELAHGLINPGTHEPDLVYLWWVVLRLVMAPFLLHRPEGDESPRSG
ncbi:MAG: DUF4209 domain-containing protein [Polyangiaceae bacterium]